MSKTGIGKLMILLANYFVLSRVITLLASETAQRNSIAIFTYFNSQEFQLQAFKYKLLLAWNQVFLRKSN